MYARIYRYGRIIEGVLSHYDTSLHSNARSSPYCIPCNTHVYIETVLSFSQERKKEVQVTLSSYCKFCPLYVLMSTQNCSPFYKKDLILVFLTSFVHFIVLTSTR